MNFWINVLLQLPSGIEKKSISELPTHVDWRDTPNVVSAVKDQVVEFFE